MTYQYGEKVLFHPEKGKPMEAEVAFPPTRTKVDLIIGSDPFPVTVLLSQVSACKASGKNVESSKKVRNRSGSINRKGRKPMKSEAKELRKQAQALGIEGWESMGRVEMRAAVKNAQKAKGKPAKAEAEKPVATKVKPAAKKSTKAKKTTAAKKSAPAKSKPAKTKPKATATKPAKAEKPEAGSDVTLAKSHPKPTPEHGENPFRKNSNLFRIAKLLLKGGSRRALASKLSEQVSLHPYQKGDDDVELLDFDKRLLLGAQTMRDTYGYGISRTGRGMDGSILVFVPGGPTDPRARANGAKKAKATTKKAKAKK